MTSDDADIWLDPWFDCVEYWAGADWPDIEREGSLVLRKFLNHLAAEAGVRLVAHKELQKEQEFLIKISDHAKTKFLNSLRDRFNIAFANLKDIVLVKNSCLWPMYRSCLLDLTAEERKSLPKAFSASNSVRDALGAGKIP